MSAKSSNSVPGDRYYTPSWVVAQGLQLVPRNLRYLDPSAGHGAFAKALVERGERKVCAVEPDTDTELAGTSGIKIVNLMLEDFVLRLKDKPQPVFDVAIGNPPFGLAQSHVELCLSISSTVVFLLRLGFLAGDARGEWMEGYRPTSIYLLRNRPKFGLPDWWVEQRINEEKAKGKKWTWGGDSADYAFIRWDRDLPRDTTFHWLPSVGLEQRKQ